MKDALLESVRAMCLQLPETAEKEAWGHPTFRVRDKIFATYGALESGAQVVCKAPPGVQAILVEADPRRFFVPAYVGHKGWVGIRLDAATDWSEVASLVARSYRLIAPKRLAALV